MNMELFVFLAFISIAALAMAFVLYIFGVWLAGEGGIQSKAAKIALYTLVPLGVTAFAFGVMAAPEGYRYGVGAIPIGIIGLMLLYVRFFKGGKIGGDSPTPLELKEKLTVPGEGDRRLTRKDLADEKRAARKEAKKERKAQKGKA